MSGPAALALAADQRTTDVAVPHARDGVGAPVALEARYVRAVGEAILTYHDFPLWVVVVVAALGAEAHLYL
jgi:hypothetical protein